MEKIEARCDAGEIVACDAIYNIRIAEASYIAFITVLAIGVFGYFWRHRKEMFNLK